jgi:hypothetical protein
MVDIRIVCTHDAVQFAENLMRLLGAEQQQVRLCYGRPSLDDIDRAEHAREAVLLVWSWDAPGQHYMREWSRRIEPARLIEIARAPGAPGSLRRAPVIDFTQWRGERGGRSWNILSDRIRTITRALEPPKPPPRQAALALGLAGIAAIGGALFVRVNEAGEASAPSATVSIAQGAERIGVGGPVESVEPESIEALTFARPPRSRFSPLDLAPAPDLLQLPQTEMPEIRDPTLLERLVGLNPLRETRSEAE